MHVAGDRTLSAVRIHRILGFLAIAHAALGLSAVLVALRYGYLEWFDRFWVAFLTAWVFWPFVLTLHRGRSIRRIAVPLFLSALFLVPCGLRFAVTAPRVFNGTARMPTLDRPNFVESENLGGGFRRVATEEFVTSGFESIYHGEYLYYRSRKLSYFVSSSLSPSRAFAAYADSDLDSETRDNQHGFHVFVFRASDEQIVRLTTEPLYYVGEFSWEWEEAAGYLLLHFKDGRPPEKFLLPPPRPNPYVGSQARLRIWVVFSSLR